MAKSMTSFGRAQSEEGKEHLFSIEMKSVNNRYLDVNIRMPKFMIALEDEVRKIINNYLNRGKVDVFINFKGYSKSNALPKVNMDLAKGYYECLKEISETLGVVNDITATRLSRFPDVLTLEAEEENLEEILIEIKPLVISSLEMMNDMRVSEGEKLKEDILCKLSDIEANVKEIEEIAENVPVNYKRKLEERIKELNKIKHDYGAQISYLYGLHLMKRYERAGELLKDIINGHNSIDTAIEVSNNSDSVISIITKGIKHNGINIILDEQADLNNIDITEFELQRVLSNIISNAVTAMDGQGTLAIRTYENFNDIIICVRNNGPMIGNIIIDKIFESGFSTKKNINKEHGFGLAIVKETVEKCNGKISVTSDIEKTEFIIILPRKKV